MDRRWLPVVIVVALVAAFWNLATFTVPQWMQAMVVQLGDPVRVVREPGLYWKIPLIQQVTYFDRRLLDYDASPKEILTIDKQQLVVDNFTRWRIVDPLLRAPRAPEIYEPGSHGPAAADALVEGSGDGWRPIREDIGDCS